MSSEVIRTLAMTLTNVMLLVVFIFAIVVVFRSIRAMEDNAKIEKHAEEEA